MTNTSDTLETLEMRLNEAIREMSNPALLTYGNAAEIAQAKFKVEKAKVDMQIYQIRMMEKLIEILEEKREPKAAKENEK